MVKISKLRDCFKDYYKVINDFEILAGKQQFLPNKINGTI